MEGPEFEQTPGLRVKVSKTLTNENDKTDTRHQTLRLRESRACTEVQR